MVARLTQWRLSSISAFGLGIALTGGCMLLAITIQFDPERHADIEALLTDADSRMYEDKRGRRAAPG